jgi:hypothetical protein
MGIIEYFSFGGIILGLLTVIVLLIVFHRSDVRDLRDRLMARDYHDFSVGKKIQKQKPLTDVEQVEKALGITQEDKELSDRLPVN